VKDPGARTVARAGKFGSLVDNVVEFCRLLKANGIPVQPGHAQIALAAVNAVNTSSRHEFRSALRISVLQKPDDIPLFNTLFDGYWRTADDDDPMPEPDTSRRPPSARQDAANDGPDAAPEPEEIAAPEAIEPTSDDSPDLHHGAAADYGAHRVVRRAQPNGVIDIGELDRIGRALAAQLASRRSRRKEPHRRGRYLDTRRLLRRSLRYGGVPIELSWRRPQIARAQLVILCDVSRSMERHAQLLIRFAGAVLRHAWRVEVFLFASELVRISHTSLDDEWADLTAGIAEAGGGTRIGDCFATLLDDYGYCFTGNRCTTVILSDGLDAGDPERVSKTMGDIARRSDRVIWLNPLLATDGYEPIARGMAAALPHVDVFASAQGVASLWALVRMLRERVSI